jgi:predicted CXXCH cytochrome family protein
MKARSAGILTLVLATLLLSLSSNAQALTIAFPPDESYVEHEAVNVVARFAKDAHDAVEIKVNNFSYPKMEIPPGAENFCLGITLAPGLNNVEVVGYKNKNETAAGKLTIYFLAELDPKANKAPRDFQKYIFHYPDNEQSCNPCHAEGQDSGKTDTSQPKTPASPCYGCHQNKISVNKYLHSPAEEWACQDCHETQDSGGKYSIAAPAEEICANCHEEVISSWQKMKIMHGPTAVGQCTVCHDPHGSDWVSFVRTNTTDLCVSCHVDKESGQHVLAGFSGKGHPTRGVPDPFNPDKEFSCSSCHSPHASEYHSMLKQDNSKMGFYCNFCHKK